MYWHYAVCLVAVAQGGEPTCAGGPEATPDADEALDRTLLQSREQPLVPISNAETISTMKSGPVLCSCEWKAFESVDCTGQHVSMEGEKHYDKAFALKHKSYKSNTDSCQLVSYLGKVEGLSVVLDAYADQIWEGGETGCILVDDRHPNAIHDSGFIFGGNKYCALPTPVPTPAPPVYCSCEWKAYGSKDCTGQHVSMETEKHYDKAFVLKHKSYKSNTDSCQLVGFLGKVEGLSVVLDSYADQIWEGGETGCILVDDRHPNAIHDSGFIFGGKKYCATPQ